MHFGEGPDLTLPVPLLVPPCRYSQQQLYDLVSNVAEYRNFVPLCTDSKVVFKNDKLMLAKLTVGFAGITESYTSKVTLKRPSSVTVSNSDSPKRSPFRASFSPFSLVTGCFQRHHAFQDAAEHVAL